MIRRVVVSAICAALLVLAVNPVARAQSRGTARPAYETVRLLVEGRTLSEAQASRLEQSLRVQPDDLEKRALLIGYYSRPSAQALSRRAELALWVIEHEPASPLAGDPACRLQPDRDRPGYEEARQLWLFHVTDLEVSTPVLSNAARFFSSSEPDLAEQLLLRASSREPDEAIWMWRLSDHQRQRALRTQEPERSEAFRQSLDYAESALAQVSGEVRRLYRLAGVARRALDAGELVKAETYAQLALAKLRRLRHRPATRINRGEVIHDAHIVLGWISLNRGDVEAAKRHLLASGRTPGAPRLYSIGPNMSLAKALIEFGEHETVLDYFELCRLFWTGSRNQLDHWRDRLRRGRMPDFGANLDY